jgi:signal transduction histidine kinase
MSYPFLSLHPILTIPYPSHLFYNFLHAGLKLLSDDLERSDDEADKDRYDILSDVKLACRASIEILNDLLCFDKLESGMLELNKHDFKILSFLSDSVNMFTSQAKEVGVSMSIILGERHDSYDTRVLDSDMISMDKFKMDQVMRNLLSNAFKFTSEGGSVIVRASFIRDASSTSNKHDIVLKTSSKLSFSYLLSSLYGVYCYSADMLRRKEQMATVDDIEMQAKHGQNGHNNDNNHHEKLDNHSHHGSLKTNDRIDLRTYDTQDEKSNFHLGERGAAHMLRGQSTVRNVQDDSGYKNFFSRLMRSSERSSEGDKSDRKILSWMAGNGERANHSKNSYRNSKCDTDTVIHGKLRITVTDTGAGLTKENISRLFNEVVQFNPEILQSGGGSGLGLWITNSIVKMHSGTVCAESAGLGKGCSFTVEVDMQRRGAHTAKAPPQPHDVGHLRSYFISLNDHFLLTTTLFYSVLLLFTSFLFFLFLFFSSRPFYSPSFYRFCSSNHPLIYVAHKYCIQKKCNIIS